MIDRYWFPDKEAMKIEVEERARVHEEQGTSSKRRYGFNALALKYHLAGRIRNQLEAYRKGNLLPEQMVTNGELAGLFRVNRSVVSRYLKKSLSDSDFLKREKLLRIAGGSRGGKNGEKKHRKSSSSD